MLKQSDARFRSFAERYLIARAPFFRVGHEAEDSWACMLDAKRIYKHVELMGTTLDHVIEAAGQF